MYNKRFASLALLTETTTFKYAGSAFKMTGVYSIICLVDSDIFVVTFSILDWLMKVKPLKTLELLNTAM